MTPQQLAEKLASEGKCIVCKTETKRTTRGLCSMHYERYSKARKMIDAPKREEWDQRLIELGQLLPSRQGKKLEADADEFAILAEQFNSGEEMQIAETAAKISESKRVKMAQERKPKKNSHSKG